MPSGKPGTRKPKPPDLRASPAKGKPLDGSKNPGGRPPEWTDDVIEDFADKLMDWAQTDDAKFLETFCKQHRTYPGKLTELAKKNGKFSEALKAAKAACAHNMAQITMLGACPPAFGIFALKQHGWTDKQEIAHSGEIAQTHRYEMPHKRVID